MAIKLFSTALAIAYLAFGVGIASAQTAPGGKSSAEPKSVDRAVSPESKGQMQPQGPTGPLETEGAAATPENPQGETPPGMQAAPDGTSKTVAPNK